MATKKTKTTRKPRKKKDPNIEKRVHHLRGNLKLKYAAAVYSMQAANAKLEAQQTSIRLRAETDTVFAEALAALSQENTLKTEVSKAIAKLQLVGKKVCEKFDIPFEEFKHYVVDTETGKVTHTPIVENTQKG